MSNTLYISADNVVQYTGARDARSGVYLNDGTATYSLKTTAGTTVTSGSLTYSADTNGDYYGTIASTVDLTPYNQDRLNLSVTFNQDNYDDYRKLAVVVCYRGAE